MQQFSGMIVGLEWITVIVIGALIIAGASVIIMQARQGKKKEQGISYKKTKPSTDEITIQNEKALGIIKQRLAKGEITKDEYQRLKKEFESE